MVYVGNYHTIHGCYGRDDGILSYYTNLYYRLLLMLEACLGKTHLVDVQVQISRFFNRGVKNTIPGGCFLLDF